MAKRYLVTVEERHGCGPLLGLLALIGLMVYGSFSNKTNAPVAPAPRSEEVPSPPVPTLPTPQNSQLWGAFSVSPSTSYSSWSKGHPSEEDAVKAAIDSCHHSDCILIASFSNGYAALATDGADWFYSFGLASQNEAEENAIKQCEQQNAVSECRITDSISF